MVGARIPEDHVDAGLEESEDTGARIPPADQSEEVLAAAKLELAERALSVDKIFLPFGGCGSRTGGGWYPDVLVFPPSKGLG